MHILRQIKNFPPIEEQLAIINSDKYLPKVNIKSIGETELLLTASKPENWKMTKNEYNEAYLIIRHNDKWFSVERYIANIFKFAGFKEIKNYGYYLEIFDTSMNSKLLKSFDKKMASTKKIFYWGRLMSFIVNVLHLQ